MTQEKETKPKIELEPSKYKKFYVKLEQFLDILETDWIIHPTTTITEMEQWIDLQLAKTSKTE